MFRGHSKYFTFRCPWLSWVWNSDVYAGLRWMLIRATAHSGHRNQGWLGRERRLASYRHSYPSSCSFWSSISEARLWTSFGFYLSGWTTCASLRTQPSDIKKKRSENLWDGWTARRNSEVNKRQGKSLLVLLTGLEIVGCVTKCMFPRKLSFERSWRFQVSPENSRVCVALPFQCGCSVAKSCATLLRPHGLHPVRPLCPPLSQINVIDSFHQVGPS